LKAERLAFRQQCVEAGLRPVDESFHLTKEEWIQYCRFFDFDLDREQYDMPCDSWRFELPEDRFYMTQIVYWYNKLERSEITREEYHRLVLDFAARLEAEASSSSGG
jgi:hypothetical protein